MRFSAGQAAFEGFRVTRQHPLAVLVWAGISLIVLAAMIAVAMATPFLQPLAGELLNILRSQATDLSAEAKGQLAYAALVIAPISLVAQAVLLPALYRAMNAEGGDRFGYVRLGRDELRVLGALVLVSIVSMMFSELGNQLIAFVAATAGGPAAAVVSLLVSLFNIFVAVRLALAAPSAFSERRIDLRAILLVTKGVFWPLLGMAIISGLLFLVVIFLLSIVALPIVGGLAQGGAGAMGAVALGAGLVLTAIAMALSMVILSAPFMAAYRELTALAQG